MGLVYKIQKYISKSDLLFRLTLKVRNQCDSVIGYRVGKENNGMKNGEYWFIKKYITAEVGCVVDVGANRGNWVSAVYRFGSDKIKAYCYEPDPRVSSDFESSVGKKERVYFKKVALGEKEGKINIFLNQNSPELTSVVEGKSRNRKTVDMTTLDIECKRNQIEYVDFFKIDVEGYEEAVLRGARTLLEAGKIGCIQFEYGENWAKAGSTLQGVVRFLRDYNFQVFLLRPKCIQRVDFEMIGEYFSYSNYIAVHMDNMSEVDNLISESLI